MINFNFNYDKASDDLFVYLEGKKSFGAVELGNFVIDFDDKGNLVAMQIIDASKVLAKILEKMVELSNIKEMKVNITNIRNIVAIRFKIVTDKESQEANILIPHIKEKSPVLQY